MILFCGICRWIHGFWPKTTDFEDCGWGQLSKSTFFGQKPQIFSRNPWFSTKNCGFFVENHGFFAGNCGFYKNHRFWPKSMVFSWKPWFSSRKLWISWKLQISAENHGFWAENCKFQPKTIDFVVSEFKTKKLFVSFQSRERIQRVSMFFLFSFFWGGVV